MTNSKQSKQPKAPKQEKQPAKKKGGNGMSGVVSATTSPYTPPQISKAVVDLRQPNPPMDSVSAKLVESFTNKDWFPSGGWVGFVYGGSKKKAAAPKKETKKSGSKKK